MRKRITIIGAIFGVVGFILKPKVLPEEKKRRSNYYESLSE